MMNLGWVGILLGGMIFWIVIVAITIWVMSRFFKATPGSGSGGNSDGGLSALEIVKRRYARGEITKEQYEQLKKDLS